MNPELRFKDQLGNDYPDWEECEINQLAQFNPKSSLPKEFEYVDLESVVGTSMISHRRENIKTAPSRAQRLAKQGDLFYQTVRPYQKNNYLFMLDYEDYVFSTGYAQLRPNCNGYYLLALVQQDKFVRKVLDNCTGTSYPAINSTKLSKIRVNTSFSKIEQDKIGSLLFDIDQKIQAQATLIEKLKNTKESMLVKMFPQGDSKVPEIRFDRFSGDWDQVCLKEVCDVRDGTHASPKYVEYGHPFITSKNVKDGDIDFSDVQYISDYDFHEINKRSKVDINDILMGMIGTIGNLALVKTEPEYSIKNVALIKYIGKISPTYLYQYLSSPNIKKIFDDIMTGGTQKFISLDKVRTLPIIIPNTKDEQEKIGQFFSNLDKEIEINQQKYDKFCDVKKALLSKMFPTKEEEQ